MNPAVLAEVIATMHTADCTASSRQFMLKLPLRTYLLVVVIRMLLPQYARMLIIGLLAAPPPGAVTEGLLAMWAVGEGERCGVWAEAYSRSGGGSASRTAEVRGCFSSSDMPRGRVGGSASETWAGCQRAGRKGAGGPTKEVVVVVATGRRECLGLRNKPDGRDGVGKGVATLLSALGEKLFQPEEN